RHSSCVSSGFLGALHGGGGDADFATLAAGAGVWKDQSLDAAGGAIWTGAAAVRGFGAGFLAATAGRGAGAFATAAGARAAADAAGSGFMMLTGGVDAALGNSALVGRPVGIDVGKPASGPAIPAGIGAGAFQDGE